MNRLIAIVALFGLGGCAGLVENFITQEAPPEVPQGAFCDIKRFSLDVELPDTSPAVDTASQNPIADGSYGRSVATALGTGAGDLLFLSGGSQDGAFGAGFLDEWQKRAGGSLPDFSVVTGISTGALQSTFAFIDRPAGMVQGYAIEQESDLLETEFNGADIRDGLSTKVILAALGDGAFSDLVPLRGRIDTLLTPDVLAEVAARYVKGRRLYVGATDVDAGRAIAFDMSELAHRITQTSDVEESRRLKDCYIEALVASSAVPGAAQPVFIDNRMYIDGGAKFAVFAEDVSNELDQNGNIISATPLELPNVYVLINGEAEFSSVCGKDDAAECVGDGPFLALKGKHIDWNFLFLAERSVAILTEQVTRLSIDRARILDRPGANPARVIRLNRAAADAHVSDLDGAFGGGAKTCDAWRDEDIANGDPIEFQPRYMRCLISFGREFAAQTDWINPQNP
ncbi:MAG: patatin-like phospholipase family protein [Pseudomonadota bacterium]